MSDNFQLIDVGHSQVAHRAVGDGPDVLCVHGWPLHSATFRNVVPQLTGYRCHLIDLPGTGQSTWSAASQIDWPGHVDTVLKVVDALGLKQVSFLAHDSGAGIARTAASKIPNRVQAVVCGNTEIPRHESWFLKMYVLGSKMPGSSAIFRQVLGAPLLRRQPFSIGGCFSSMDAAPADFEEIFVDPLVQNKRVLNGQMHFIRNFDQRAIDALEQVHAKLTAPTLLVWGEKDPFFPLRLAKQMTRQFAGPVDLEVIADAKLFVHEEHPEHFGSLARAFFDRHVKGQAAGQS